MQQYEHDHAIYVRLAELLTLQFGQHPLPGLLRVAYAAIVNVRHLFTLKSQRSEPEVASAREASVCCARVQFLRQGFYHVI